MTVPPPPRRLLIVRVGAMGDVLHALPAAAALRAAFPKVQIHWLIDPRWAPLLAGTGGPGPIVSGVHLAETRLWSRAPLSAATRRSVLGLRRALVAGQYDLVVDMQGTLRSAVLGRLAQAPCYAGFDDPRERMARPFYKTPLQRTGTHVVEQGAALLGAALGTTLNPARELTLPRDPAAEQWAEALVAACPPQARIALLAPAAGWGAKQWPANRFAALAQALTAEGLTVLVNAPSATEHTAQTVAGGGSEGIRIVPCGVAQLIALTRRATVVLGGDSGPVHLAAALGIPVVALYGPTDPARNGPWGASPVRVLRHPSSRTSYRHVAAPDPGLARIAVEEVLSAVLSLRSNLFPEGSNPFSS